MTAKPLHIALLAGETSGDLLGAPLLAALRERLHEVEKAYQTKLEAREHKGEVLELLREIKSDLKEVNDKLDRKADK